MFFHVFPSFLSTGLLKLAQGTQHIVQVSFMSIPPKRCIGKWTKNWNLHSKTCKTDAKQTNRTVWLCGCKFFHPCSSGQKNSSTFKPLVGGIQSVSFQYSSWHVKAIRFRSFKVGTQSFNCQIENLSWQTKERKLLEGHSKTRYAPSLYRKAATIRAMPWSIDVVDGQVSSWRKLQ